MLNNTSTRSSHATFLREARGFGGTRLLKEDEAIKLSREIAAALDEGRITVLSTYPVEIEGPADRGSATGSKMNRIVAIVQKA